MIIFTQAQPLTAHLLSERMAGKSLGFVPTMGALHEGHMSLINLCKLHNSLTICSIYVNPTQFNQPEDFQKYPKTTESDIAMLEREGCDILFLPDTQEIYPDGPPKGSPYDLGHLDEVLEGQHRPGHFQGVCMVVHRLLTLVPADVLYLGRKDYQQCRVLIRMIDMLHLPTRVITAPTIRQSDGLALSSRNARLRPEAREKATAIYRCLLALKSSLEAGPTQPWLENATATLTEAGLIPEYVAITDIDLKVLDHWDGHTPTLGLVAAFLDGVRLIDNMELR